MKDNGIMILEAFKEDQNEVALVQTCYTEHQVDKGPHKEWVADMIEMKGIYEEEKEHKLQLEQGYDFETAALMIMMKTLRHSEKRNLGMHLKRYLKGRYLHDT